MTRTTSETLRAAADFVDTLPPILRDSVSIEVKGNHCSAHWREATAEVGRAVIAAYPVEPEPDEDDEDFDDDGYVVNTAWHDAGSFFYRFDTRPGAVVRGWWVHLAQPKPAVVVTATSLLAEARG